MAAVDAIGKKEEKEDSSSPSPSSRRRPLPPYHERTKSQQQLLIHQAAAMLLFLGDQHQGLDKCEVKLQTGLKQDLGEDVWSKIEKLTKPKHRSKLQGSWHWVPAANADTTNTTNNNSNTTKPQTPKTPKPQNPKTPTLLLHILHIRLLAKRSCEKEGKCRGFGRVPQDPP